MGPLHIELLERGLRLKNRLTGVGWHPDPWKHYGPGGVEEAEARCAEANRDLLGFLRPHEPPRAAGLLRSPGRQHRGVFEEVLSFDSPRPSGRANNDRVEVRLYRARHGAPGRVVLFHHPIYQQSWAPWVWFLRGVIAQVPVAMMAQPYHYARTPPGEFCGEGVCNPNPWRLFEAIRQWCWDQAALCRLLQERMELEPAAVIGFSMGAFNSLLATAAGLIELPLVSIASTNRYAYGVFNGVSGVGIRRAMLRLGIDESRLLRMTESLQLERHAPRVRTPVLFIEGRYDEVDPPPSSRRLREALSPARTLALPAGHGSLLLHRGRIASEVARWLRQQGALEADPPSASRR